MTSRWRQRPGPSLETAAASAQIGPTMCTSMLGRWCPVLFISDALGTHQRCSAGHAAERFGQLRALQLQLLQEFLGQADVHGQREPLTDVLQWPG